MSIHNVGVCGKILALEWCCIEGVLGGETDEGRRLLESSSLLLRY